MRHWDGFCDCCHVFIDDDHNSSTIGDYHICEGCRSELPDRFKGKADFLEHLERVQKLKEKQ